MTAETEQQHDADQVGDRLREQMAKARAVVSDARETLSALSEPDSFSPPEANKG